MSSLVLPGQQVNQTLENNLKAFFNRYPHERRIEETLRIPAPQYKLEEIELPPAPSKPPIRVLSLCGIGNPVFLATLLNDRTVQEQNFKVFIIEQDPVFLAYCFQNSDLTQVINYAKTEWFLLHNEESIKGALFRAMKPAMVTSMMLNVQQLQVVVPNNEEYQKFYENFGKLYDETARHVIHNNGNLNDSLLGVDVTLQNKDYILNNPGIKDLEDYYKGCTAVIVGAGHSTEANLEALKKNNDKLVVIAADAALKPLLAAGIRVDYCVSIERLNSYQKPFFEGLENVSTELVAFPVLHPDVLAAYPGKIRIVYRNYSFYAYFEKAFPKGILRCGGSASHLGLRLAAYMGCSTILLVGLDSTYEEKDKLYRSHMSGTGHPEWGQFVDITEFQKRRHAQPIQVPNNEGGTSTSNITYWQWAKEISEELAYLGFGRTIINCSAKGAVMSGVPYKPLEEAVKTTPAFLPEKPATPEAAFTRSWSNKELYKNFKGWLQMIDACLKESEELMKSETVDLDRYQALFFLYEFRMLIDDMFVAFVIQCCATKYFELDNKWWSLDIRGDQDLPLKIQVLRDRFVLFKMTLEPLMKMIEREREDVSTTDS